MKIKTKTPLRHPLIIAGIIISLLISCTKEAPIVTGFLDTDTATPAQPGYYYPMVTAVYPANGTTNAPADTSFVMVFNIPVTSSLIDAGVSISSSQMGALASGSDYTITATTTPSTTSAKITFSYFSGINTTLAETVSVTTSATITDYTNDVALNNPGTYTFTIPANAHPDTTSPTINTSGNVTPTDGTTDIALTGITITCIFTETGGIDPSTINSLTFYVENGGTNVPVSYSYNSGTQTLTVTPTIVLSTSTTYTVHATSGIKDLSGNSLTGVTWSFTTTGVPLTPTDPYTGAPSVTQDLAVNAVTSTSATVNWITSEPTNHTLTYGSGTDMTSTAVETNYYSNHTEDLALSAGKRYWVQLPAANYQDVVGTAGSNSSPASDPLQFNALTTETYTVVHDGSYSQGNIRSIAGSSNGAFLAWDASDGTYTHVYGQKYDSSFTGAWASPKALFSGSKNYTYQGMSHDSLGGLIVMTAVSGSGVYAKHITTAGAFDWGTDADAATDDGVQVTTTTPSNVYAVPVYTNITTVLRSGTTDMGCLSMGAAPLYDSTTDFTSAANGDILINPTSKAGTTVVKNASSDHRNVIGQTASIIAGGENYVIGDTPGTGYTSVEYRTNNNGTFALLDSTAVIYTISTDSWNGGDLVQVGSDYVQLSSSPVLTLSFTMKSSGTPTLVEDYHLRDAFNGENWTTLLDPGDIVFNTSPEPDLIAQVDEVLSSFQVSLCEIESPYDPVHIFTSILHNYEIWDDAIYNLLSTDSIYILNLTGTVNLATASGSYTLYPYLLEGTAESLPSEPLLDNDPSADFDAGTAVQTNDIAINWTDTTTPNDPNVCTVSFIDPLVLGLSGGSGIFSDDEDYSIIRFPNLDTDASDIVDTGSATSTSSGHLVDSGNTFGSVQAGDIACNLTDSAYAMITSVASNDLTLSHDASFDLNDHYIIIRKRGILYVWQNGSSVMGKIMEMSAGAEPAILRDEFTIATGTGAVAVSDEMGNALVTYVDGSGEIQTAQIDGAGNAAWTTEADTQTAAAESIIDVQPDGTGGVFILYRYSSDTYVQHIGNTGTRWGTTGKTLDTDGATSVTSQEQMIQAGTDVIVVANVNNDIVAWRRGETGPTDWSTTVTSLSTSTQQNPQAYFDGTNCVIVWEDDRFLSSSGYGIFGLMVDGSGTPVTTWDADYDSATDYNGVAIILNNFNEYWSVPTVVSYNGGTDAVLIWEDYRAGDENDIIYIDLDAFTPY